MTRAVTSNHAYWDDGSLWYASEIDYHNKNKPDIEEMTNAILYMKKTKSNELMGKKINGNVLGFLKDKPAGNWVVFFLYLEGFGGKEVDEQLRQKLGFKYATGYSYVLASQLGVSYNKTGRKRPAWRRYPPPEILKRYLSDGARVNELIDFFGIKSKYRFRMYIKEMRKQNCG